MVRRRHAHGNAGARRLAESLAAAETQRLADLTTEAVEAQEAAEGAEVTRSAVRPGAAARH